MVLPDSSTIGRRVAGRRSGRRSRGGLSQRPGAISGQRLVALWVASGAGSPDRNPSGSVRDCLERQRHHADLLRQRHDGHGVRAVPPTNSVEAQIANAMSAGPDVVGRDATIWVGMKSRHAHRRAAEEGANNCTGTVCRWPVSPDDLQRFDPCWDCLERRLPGRRGAYGALGWPTCWPAAAIRTTPIRPWRRCPAKDRDFAAASELFLCPAIWICSLHHRPYVRPALHHVEGTPYEHLDGAGGRYGAPPLAGYLSPGDRLLRDTADHAARSRSVIRLMSRSCQMPVRFPY